MSTGEALASVAEPPPAWATSCGTSGWTTAEISNLVTKYAWGTPSPTSLFGCKRSPEIQKHPQDANLSSPSHYPQDEQKHVQEVQVKLQSSDDPNPLYHQRVSL
jgi:hypothetical protein